MAHRALNRRYHDAILSGCRIGPQRELVLEMRLDPVWNPGAPVDARVRFGGIENFEEVRTFFGRVVAASWRGVLDSVEGIECNERGRWIVRLDQHGSITLVTPKEAQEY